MMGVGQAVACAWRPPTASTPPTRIDEAALDLVELEFEQLGGLVASRSIVAVPELVELALHHDLPLAMIELSHAPLVDLMLVAVVDAQPVAAGRPPHVFVRASATGGSAPVETDRGWLTDAGAT